MAFEWQTFEKVLVETDFPIAVDSPDHHMPWGTARDNSINPSFNHRLLKLFHHKIGIKVLDLGCSGGGFIKSCVDQGCFGVGLEGSDYSLRFYRAHWPLLGGKVLFTADITKPYFIKSLHRGGHIQEIKFDVITMWEVLEHLQEAALTQTCDNIKRHLAEEGILFLSVSPNEETIQGVTLHQTVQSEEWWTDRLEREGLYRIPELERIFSGHYIRGPKQNAPGSCNFILSRTPERIQIPESLKFPSKRKKLFSFFKT